MFLRRSYRGVIRPSSRCAAWAVDGGSRSRKLSTTAVAALGIAPTAPRRQQTKRDHVYGVSPASSYFRQFHASSRMQAVKPVILADIGEGIVECEIIQWFVQPGARVEEFSPLCEVQSDKASVEITSRFAGIVKKLYYEAGEMAKVGKPFVDIDLPEDVSGRDSSATQEEQPAATPAPTDRKAEGGEQNLAQSNEMQTQTQHQPEAQSTATVGAEEQQPPKKKFAGSSLATPAVRHLSKELNVDITQVDGTGKDGRVLKEDLHRFVEEQKRAASSPASAPSPSAQQAASRPPVAPSVDVEDAPQQETVVPLGGTQLGMFKSMTRSLAIPHFLYADEIDFTQLFSLRQRVNATLARLPPDANAGVAKLSYLPFVIKALSLALYQYPVLNARVEVPPADANGSSGSSNNNGGGSKPRLVYRSQHNIGVAMDTPAGLVVPVIHNVNARSVLSIAAELARLQGLAMAGKLAPADLQGGTITVSNIGNVGGTYLSPVIVEREVAILGIGRVRTVPAFADDADEGTGAASQRIVKRHVCHFSFSADHRVVDGATMARAAEVVRQMVERPDTMILNLR